MLRRLLSPASLTHYQNLVHYCILLSSELVYFSFMPCVIMARHYIFMLWVRNSDKKRKWKVA